MISNFDKYPSIAVSDRNEDCLTGWDNICSALMKHVSSRNRNRHVMVVDCYHGVLDAEVVQALRNGLPCQAFFNSTDAFKSEKEVSLMVYPDVTDDRIFGYMTELTLDKFFDEDKLSNLRQEIETVKEGIVVIYGEGAAWVAQEWDTLVYLDMARWEIQLRMRRNEISNLGVSNRNTEFSLQYKQAYFVDWRVLDKYKIALIDRWDFVIDTNKIGNPKMVKA